MQTVLLVDDDPIVVKVYAQGLLRQGFTVWTASGGLEAIKFLRETKPDIIVLDLMMTGFSGVEVLKTMRQDPTLKDLPVVVFSNAYMADMTRQVMELGVQQALLKEGCTPALLASCLNDVLRGISAGIDIPRLTKTNTTQRAESNTGGPTPAASSASAPAKGQPNKPPAAPSEQPEVKLLAQDVFQARAADTRAGLRQAFEAFRAAPNASVQRLRLQDFYRRVHFLTATAGLAERRTLARLASALEALLHHLLDKQDGIGASVLRTTLLAIEELDSLLQQPEPGNGLGEGRILVVDDDKLSNRLVISGLRQAGLQGRGTEDPLIGLKWAQEKPFDLVVLELNLPGMDTTEFCRQLRAWPGYEAVPVIYVTSAKEFDGRVATALAPGEDVITKPVMPAELALKIVMRLMQSKAP